MIAILSDLGNTWRIFWLRKTATITRLRVAELESPEEGVAFLQKFAGTIKFADPSLDEPIYPTEFIFPLASHVTLPSLHMTGDEMDLVDFLPVQDQYEIYYRTAQRLLQPVFSLQPNKVESYMSFHLVFKPKRYRINMLEQEIPFFISFPLKLTDLFEVDFLCQNFPGNYLKLQKLNQVLGKIYSVRNKKCDITFVIL